MAEGKLRNFSEVEVFVTISCPFSTNIDSEEYKGMYILNPMEVYMAFNIDNWGKMDLFDYGSGQKSLLDILPD